MTIIDVEVAASRQHACTVCLARGVPRECGCNGRVHEVMVDWMLVGLSAPWSQAVRVLAVRPLGDGVPTYRVGQSQS